MFPPKKKLSKTGSKKPMPGGSTGASVSSGKPMINDGDGDERATPAKKSFPFQKGKK